jgi:hypothetical protein
VIYLSGVTNDTIEQRLIETGIGLMTSQLIAYSVERVSRFPFVGYDNGCFRSTWIEDDWINWLSKQPRERSLFAVSPDVYPDAAESLRRGLEYAPIIRDMGFPVAVVAQTDAEQLEWPWDEVDCLFVGGERTADPRAEWKESEAAAGLVRRARNAGKWVHMGRVNDEYRYARAELMGCQSVDGTMLAFGPDANIGRLTRMVRRRHNRPPLPFERWESPSHPTHKGVVHG